MKRFIHDIGEDNLIYVEAMSTINPRLCKEYGIRVEVEERNEGPIPHIHVYHDPSRNPRKCSYIRLDRAEYSDHHGELSTPLPKEAKKQFIAVMKASWPKANHVLPDGSSRIANGYEAAVDTWVECYEDDYSKFELDENGELVMPDYSTL